MKFISLMMRTLLTKSRMRIIIHLITKILIISICMILLRAWLTHWLLWRCQRGGMDWGISLETSGSTISRWSSLWRTIHRVTSTWSRGRLAQLVWGSLTHNIKKTFQRTRLKFKDLILVLRYCWKVGLSRLSKLLMDLVSVRANGLMPKWLRHKLGTPKSLATIHSILYRYVYGLLYLSLQTTLHKTQMI